jgi:hypothetical protein
MDLRTYAQEMGLRIVCELTSTGFRCRIMDVRLDDSCGKPEVAADGATEEKAYRALVHLITGRTLRSTLRSTTLYWVPPYLKA